MRGAWSVSDDLSQAVASYTRAMTWLMTVPARWCATSARGVAGAFEEAALRSPARGGCYDPCGPRDACDPCADLCGPGKPDYCAPGPCARCGSCGPCGCDGPGSGCGDPSCCSCGWHGTLKVGAEVETKSGLAGEVTKIEDCHVTIESGTTTFKVTKNSICKVLCPPLGEGDVVRTTAGFLGKVDEIEEDGGVKIDSGGTTFLIDRKSICEITKRNEREKGKKGGTDAN